MEEMKFIPENHDLFLRWKDATILLCSQCGGIVQSDTMNSERTLEIWERTFQEHLNKLSGVFIDTKLYIMDEIQRGGEK